ncbi:MAG TPA: anti-sigma factor, partial [Pyrinomonadaceae bacterium]
MVHEDYKEMIPARALSALDAAEERALNEHLDNCAECRKELEDWQATAAALAVVPDPVEPSPEVRERILNEVRKDLSADVIPFRSTPRNVWTSFGSLGAIAAVVLFAALIVGLIVLWRQNRAAQANIATLSDQLENTRRDLQRSNEFVQLVTRPGAQVHELIGTENAAGANAKLAYDKTGNALLIAHGLPSVPKGKEYQLWFIVSGERPIPGKTFAPDNTGSATLKDSVPEKAVNGIPTFAITLEPLGGVQSPTGPMY